MSKRIPANGLGICFVLSFILIIAVVGCQKASTPKAGPAAFDSAPAEVKQEWEKIAAAVATNDYTSVILNCRELLKDDSLTPEQRQTVIATQTSMNDKLFAAAQKGDAAAQQALTDIRSRWR